MKVERDAVTKIHGRGSDPAECDTCGDARLWPGILGPGLAERAGDVDALVRFGGAAKKRLAQWDAAAAHDVGHDLVGAGKIATSELDVKALGETKEAAIKLVGPLTGAVTWNGQRNQAEDRLSAHGGQIGEAARQGFMADVGCFCVTREVAIFDNEVGGKDEIGFGGGPDDGTIVSNALDDGGV